MSWRNLPAWPEPLLVPTNAQLASNNIAATPPSRQRGGRCSRGQGHQRVLRITWPWEPCASRSMAPLRITAHGTIMVHVCERRARVKQGGSHEFCCVKKSYSAITHTFLHNNQHRGRRPNQKAQNTVCRGPRTCFFDTRVFVVNTGSAIVLCCRNRSAAVLR